MSDTKTENKVCSLYSKLAISPSHIGQSFLQISYGVSHLNGGEEVSTGWLFLVFFFLQKHSKNLIFCYLHWLKGAGDVKMYGFLSRLLKFLIYLFVTIMKSECAGN